MSAKERTTKSEEPSNPNIEVAYTYNATGCVTGEEDTCIETTCYKNKNSDSCPAGTILKYKINNNDTKYFYVLHDDGDTMTMQQRENTVYNVAWYFENNNNTLGPINALSAIENATNDWSNVNPLTYTMGTTVFKTNEYTGCDATTCTTNKYILGEKNTKARMVTIQELALLGCSDVHNTCPIWVSNYLESSIEYGGTVNDSTHEKNYGYWTMSACNTTTNAWRVNMYLSVDKSTIADTNRGARAGIEISK